MQTPTTIKRKDGKIYTLKQDNSRFYYPREWTSVEDKLKPRQKHTARLLIHTGARINEVRHILSSDIDFNNKRLVLRITKTKAKKGEKRGKPRTIPISTQLSKYLKKYCLNKGMIDRNGNIIKDSNLNILNSNSFAGALKIASKKAGIKNYRDFSAHNLRKTLETWLMSLGVSDSNLLAHFGHDLKTLSSHYVSPDVFSNEEKMMIRTIIGDLYYRR